MSKQPRKQRRDSKSRIPTVDGKSEKPTPQPFYSVVASKHNHEEYNKDPSNRSIDGKRKTALSPDQNRYIVGCRNTDQLYGGTGRAPNELVHGTKNTMSPPKENSNVTGPGRDGDISTNISPDFCADGGKRNVLSTRQFSPWVHGSRHDFQNSTERERSICGSAKKSTPKFDDGGSRDGS